MKKLSRNQIVIIATVGFLLIGFIFLVATNRREQVGTPQQGKLTVWGPETRQVFDALSQGYRVLHPETIIEYTYLPPEEYASRLLEAVASGYGPDVFYLGNSDLPKTKSRLTPVNPQQFGLVKFRELFPGVVENDFVVASGSQIYALPLYLDTLALIYNRDIFDQEGVVSPPANWDDFVKVVPKLRAVNQVGQISRAAVAMGGSDNTIRNAADILNLLMMQNGAKMTSDDLRFATFAYSAEKRNPGLDAFNFYLQFSNAVSPYYTWNDSQVDSVDGFAGGKTAMILDYQSAVTEIKNKSPFLNFAVAPVPQPAGAALNITYPRYYGLAVSKQTKYPDLAWDFVIYATTNADAGKVYTQSSGHPPAQRPLIEQTLADPVYGVFGRQALTARSWYRVDAAAVGKIFSRAIMSVISGQVDSDRALRQAQDQVTQILSASSYNL